LADLFLLVDELLSETVCIRVARLHYGIFIPDKSDHRNATQA
jgi:hypothetical protein